MPISSIFFTSSTTVGLRWPASIAPKPIERSKTFRPSTSSIQAPLADLIEIGNGSQCWNEDCTPRGVLFFAIIFSEPERLCDELKSSHCSCRALSIFDCGTGLDFPVRIRRVSGWFFGANMGFVVQSKMIRSRRTSYLMCTLLAFNF